MEANYYQTEANNAIIPPIETLDIPELPDLLCLKVYTSVKRVTSIRYTNVFFTLV